jgi:hypothetical protein
MPQGLNREDPAAVAAAWAVPYLSYDTRTQPGPGAWVSGTRSLMTPRFAASSEVAVTRGLAAWRQRALAHEYAQLTVTSVGVPAEGDGSDSSGPAGTSIKQVLGNLTVVNDQGRSQRVATVVVELVHSAAGWQVDRRVDI